MLVCIKISTQFVKGEEEAPANYSVFLSLLALTPWISTFSQPGVRDYSLLTLDLTRDELIVGAR